MPIPDNRRETWLWKRWHGQNYMEIMHLLCMTARLGNISIWFKITKEKRTCDQWSNISTFAYFPRSKQHKPPASSNTVCQRWSSVELPVLLLNPLKHLTVVNEIRLHFELESWMTVAMETLILHGICRGHMFRQISWVKLWIAFTSIVEGLGETNCLYSSNPQLLGCGFAP